MYKQLHKTTTDELIETYHLERLSCQEKGDQTEFGSIVVRVYFNHDSLCVEVIQARNVIPLDTNGKYTVSDTLILTLISSISDNY